MLFQAIVFNVIFLIFYAIIFLIGVLITRWLAKMYEYNESWLPAISMNGLWFGVTFIVSGSNDTSPINIPILCFGLIDIDINLYEYYYNY